MVDYYRQRASAGFVVSEGTQIEPRGQGYARTPGIYTDTQIAGWRKATETVHAERGVIFAQLWHVGRVSHTGLQPNGEAPLAPSAIFTQKVKAFIEIEPGPGTRIAKIEEFVITGPVSLVNVPETIRIAVPPVFLLTALGALLSVTTGGLARVIDRARVWGSTARHDHLGIKRAELRLIPKRIRLIGGSILFAAASALAVCLVIVLLFVSSLIDLHIGIAVALTFIVSMLLLMGSLIPSSPRSGSRGACSTWPSRRLRTIDLARPDLSHRSGGFPALPNSRGRSLDD